MTQPPPQQPETPNPPAWYPDPAGVAGRYRYWDGQQWREDVTFDPNAPRPDTLGSPGGSSTSRKTWVGVAIGAVVVLAAAILVLALVVPGLVRPSDPGESTPAPTRPVTAATGTPGTGELNCAGGNQVSIDKESTSYTSTGATITVPAGWGFRMQKDQWTWLDDQAAWGTLTTEGEDRFLTGVVLGGLADRNGFSEPEQATADVITCMNRYGVYNDKEYPQQEVASEAVTINGMKGWKRVQEFTDAPDGKYPKTTVTVYVVDSGQPAKFVSLVTVAPSGHSQSVEAVEQVAQSLTKA